ncbi:Imm8 family immunity protein [Microbacteriaceae bacterium 4G12]
MLRIPSEKWVHDERFDIEWQTMRAVVSRVYSPDIDLENYLPADPSYAGGFIQLLVSPSGGDGEESFGLMVCTPTWAATWIQEHGPIVGRHWYFVLHWNTRVLLAELSRLVEAEEAPTWDELAMRIGRIGHWEFEDYKLFVE